MARERKPEEGNLGKFTNVRGKITAEIPFDFIFDAEGLQDFFHNPDEFISDTFGDALQEMGATEEGQQLGYSIGQAEVTDSDITTIKEGKPPVGE